MAEVLGVGLTHYPLLAGADTHMANLLKSTLKDPDIPVELKDPSSWLLLAQEEWGTDGGVAAAQHHDLRDGGGQGQDQLERGALTVHQHTRQIEFFAIQSQRLRRYVRVSPHLHGVEDAGFGWIEIKHQIHFVNPKGWHLVVFAPCQHGLAFTKHGLSPKGKGEGR